MTERWWKKRQRKCMCVRARVLAHPCRETKRKRERGGGCKERKRRLCDAKYEVDGKQRCCIDAKWFRDRGRECARARAGQGAFSC